MVRSALRNAIDLAGPWALSDLHGEHNIVCELPGDVHSALHKNGVIADPYVGRNEHDVQWVAERDWRARSSFVLLDEDIKAHWYLEIEGLDTVAEISVNGQKILSADNMFRRYRIDLKQELVRGENQIEILFRSNIVAARERQAQQPFYVPFQAENSPIPDGNMLRKVQCHFGWDWNIAIAPFGLYGTIALKRQEGARIEHVVLSQSHNSDSTDVSVAVEIELDSAVSGNKCFEVCFNGEVRTVELDHGSGVTRHVEAFRVENPDLWWPAGAGDQPLYKVIVCSDVERIERVIGLCRIVHLTDRDQAGSRFAIEVNGQEIFCRGANWIPADALFSGATPDLVEDLLTSAHDANMNMIRVWGGGFYESDHFYEICARLGLLVWQDFMFACNLYPSDEAFLEDVAEEVNYQVKRLSGFPIAIWCGDNELVGALTWFPESRDNRDRYLVSYDRLNRTIEVALKNALPTANWWPSSPAAGYLDFGDAWHNDDAGDMHYWSVWHEGKSFDNYRSVKPRFCSEFGFQSFPSLSTINRFADPGDMNIASPVMESHQKNAGGNARIAETMFRYFRFPKDFPNFVYMSQVQQGLAKKTAVDYWRSLKPHCMGAIYWQLNDTWPVASWAGLDHGGDWKLLHHMAKDFFQPINVVAYPTEHGDIKIVAVNDLRADVDIRVEQFSVSMDGQRKKLGKNDVIVSPDAAADVALVAPDKIAPGAIFYFEWFVDGQKIGSDHLVPSTYKQLDLSNPAISWKTTAIDDTIIIQLQSKALAFFVSLEADCGGRFSDNAIMLFPDQPVEISFSPAGLSPDEALDKIRVRDLYSASYEETHNG